MKTIITALLFISFSASAQVDSNSIKQPLSLQVKDWLYISSHIRNVDQFERVYDSIKARVHVLTNATSTSVVKIDSISNGNLIAIAQRLRTQSYGLSVPVFTRINNALRAVPDTYVQGRIDAMDAGYTDTYTNLIKGELDRIKRARQ